MSPDLIDNLQSARDRLMPKVTACWGDAFDGDFDSMLDAINAMKRYAANIEQDRAAFRQLTEQRAALLEALKKCEYALRRYTIKSGSQEDAKYRGIGINEARAAIAFATQQCNATGGEG